MIDLGTVRPGSTIRIPFSTYDKDDGSSITATNYAAGDMLLYKDGSTTERSDTTGFTATTDFDGKTGKHLAIINLADNTVAGFFAAGSEYLLAIDAITVDVVTTGGWIARFRIGYPNALHDTTIATLSTQTSFTLTAGPAEDDALNGCIVAIHDVASAVQMGFAVVADYTGSTKTVTLTAGTTFTAAASDNISFFPPVNVTHIGATAQTANDNGADINEILTDTGTTLQAEVDGIQADTEDIQTRLPAALVSGRIDASVGAMAANVLTATAINADAITAAKLHADVTTELQSGLATAAALDTVDNFLDTEIAAIITTLGTPAGASLAADIAAIEAQTDDIGAAGAGLTAVPWNAAWDAEVQSEVQDALDAAVAEPGQGTPGATVSIVTKIGFLYKAWRNRSTQTASEYALYGDDAVTKDQEAAVSDNGTTLDRGEVATGA